MVRFGIARCRCAFGGTALGIARARGALITCGGSSRNGMTRPGAVRMLARAHTAYDASGGTVSARREWRASLDRAGRGLTRERMTSTLTNRPKPVRLRWQASFVGRAEV